MAVSNQRLTPDCHRIIAAEIQLLDALARSLELVWGIGRLQTLVDAGLAARFQAQVDLLNDVLESETATREEILDQIGGMKRAWVAIDQVARNAGHAPKPAEVWEVQLEDGTVAMIVRDDMDASQVSVQARERRCALYTLAEIGRLLSRYPEIAKVKNAFPGALATEVRHRSQLSADLNDSIPF